VFHFSKAKKANPRQKQTSHCHRLFLRLYANFDQPLLGVLPDCIPVTLCMARLLHHEPTDDSTYISTYKLTSAPVRAYVVAEKAGRSFRMINPEHESIQDEPCWKLGGFVICCASQSGQLLGANNNPEYIEALEESSFAYLMSVSAFLTKSIRHKQNTGALTFWLCKSQFVDNQLSRSG
jgi:hypothetical protein